MTNAGTTGGSGARQVLRGGTVLTMDPRRRVYSPGAVVIEGHRLAYVGPEASWTPRPGDRAVDCRGLLILPGLVNAHTHAALSMFRGVAEDRPREAWGVTYGLPFMDRAVPEDYYWGAMLGGLEMLANGITCIADRLSDMAIIAPAFDRIGIRAVVCHTLWDVGRSLEWDQAMALIDRWGVDRERRVHCGIGPHAPNTCSDDLLRRIRALADRTGARVFIHCAQSQAEVAAMRSRGYEGSVRALAAVGLLGPDVVAAHCLYVDDEEIGLLARTGTWVAHCPASNAKVEGRVAPAVEMLRRGARVALATDWAPTNNGMDLLDEMKCAGLLNKVAAGAPEAMPVDRLLAMVTVDAAEALGLGDLIGSLEAGKRADVVALATEGLHLQPWANLPATLVYSAKGMDVRHVWVDGRQVVRDRKPLLADAQEVRHQVGRIWRRLDPRGSAAGLADR
ncbi:MAG: amidohydrolase [Armatimonadota bacterium]|nr:amidohydrolase [Armatimonadota bacterium]MDR7453929.1 amidohydrolase [Armatimonadota bacterium]MDR7457672.1 amidohydrolase [Armatimonadota bacterium]MDR7495740.1 amidohydrolase [Armatimonadota bacterium]MDR7511035.1 amidohydrolase [Armatimonadota bacterium]